MVDTSANPPPAPSPSPVNAPPAPSAPQTVPVVVSQADAQAKPIPVSKPPVADVPAPPTQEILQPPTASRQQRLADATELHFLQIKALTSSYFTHEAVCTKCGWHSMQHNAADAYAMGRQHVMQHWKEVAAEVDSQ